MSSLGANCSWRRLAFPFRFQDCENTIEWTHCDAPRRYLFIATGERLGASSERPLGRGVSYAVKIWKVAESLPQSYCGLRNSSALGFASELEIQPPQRCHLLPPISRAWHSTGTGTVLPMMSASSLYRYRGLFKDLILSLPNFKTTLLYYPPLETSMLSSPQSAQKHPF